MTEASSAKSRTAMQPTRDPRATLPDLIEVLLNKGVYLNLDLIVSVADIPLIGVNLKATIAGIETMLEYGMMRGWDEQTRRWVQQSVSRNLPMAPGEEIVAKMAGGHYEDTLHHTWRPGSAYLTTRRLIIFRRDPKEILWQAELDSIESMRGVGENAVGGETRTRIAVTLKDGSEARLSAAEPERLLKLVREQAGRTAAEASTGTQDVGQPLREGRLWYLETRSDTSVWRGGKAKISATDGLTWHSPMENRAALRLRPTDVLRLCFRKHDNPSDFAQVLSIETERGNILLAANDIDQWHQSLKELTPQAHGGAS